MTRAAPTSASTRHHARPSGVTAALVLADGSVFWGHGLGATGTAVGEVCFNTSMTGYQEILTDPSYAGQIITFTFPHIGNVGTNADDIETMTPAARGVVLRSAITEPSSWRAALHLEPWLKSHGLIGISGVDTRALTRRIRELGETTGAPSAAICHAPTAARRPEALDAAALAAKAQAWPGLDGMDLAREVTCGQSYSWFETNWDWGLGPEGQGGYGAIDDTDLADAPHVVAMDFGAKRNILRCLAGSGCRVTVVPATASASDILGHRPDGIFLSNGPGDPAATGAYAVPVIQQLLAAGVPLFGICLGHQLLARALGATTAKMAIGHRGANHPVKDLGSGKVEITSQNHGFVVGDDLPPGVEITHRSLFDGTLEGLRVTGKPVFSVQYHPEASPGPQDSHYLFDRFKAMMGQSK